MEHHMAAKSIEQQLKEIEERRKALIEDENTLIANGKPHALNEIKHLVDVFHVTLAELQTCHSQQPVQSNEMLMTNGLIKKYNKFIDLYPQYKEQHLTVKVEFLGKDIRVPTEKPLAMNHEFDQFISWIYKTNNLSTDRDKWPTTPIKTNKTEIYKEVRKLLKGWKLVAADQLANEEAFKHLDTLKSVFKSEDKLRKASDIAIHAALTTLHSYRNALKRGEGKTEPQHIFAPDQSQKLRNSLSYLLFNRAPVEVRIANMCFNPAFDIKGMGVPMITELVGWHSPSEPLINDRVATVLRHLGCDVEPFPLK
jgi:hypothetical protein